MPLGDVTPDEDRMIQAFMARMADTPVDLHVASADVIWLKARLLRRWEAEQRATVPLDMIEPIQVIAALAATVFLLIWSVPLLVRAVLP